MSRRVNNTQRAPRRPRKCGRCDMFGHDRRNCHLRWENSDDWRSPPFHRITNIQWREHCNINAQWVAEGGAGHDVPEPQPPQPPKTPFELACENKCKITETEDCCICMEKLGDKNTTTTACGHQFHFGCLVQHTSTSNSCPMCRSVICPEMPKKELKMPTDDDIRRFAIGSSAQLAAVIGRMVNLDNVQVDFIGEALGQVIADTNIAVLTNVRRRNA